MLRKITYTFFLLFLFSQTQAQVPVNDDCTTSVQLGTAPFGTCTTTEFTNVDATQTVIFSSPADNVPSCWSSVNNDVWFEFQTPTDGSFVDFQISVTSAGSNPIGQFKAALYRGECLEDELAELGCQVAPVGETEIVFDDASTSGLTPGLTYFIRVDDQSSTATPVWGTFNVCVDSLPDINIMCDDTFSDANSGMLFDSGGPDNDYSSNENCSFTICPTDPTGCIQLNLDFYDIDGTGFFSADFLNIFDGNSINAPLIGEPNINGGGSCYSVFASSGCVTLQWIADDFTEDVGYQISWESTAGNCPNFTAPNLTNNPTDAMILEKLGVSSSVVSNISVTCADNAHAAFDGYDGSLLGMGEGLVLTTGSADYALQPNDTDGDPTVGNNNNTDNDLINLSNTLSGNQPNLEDACILEMDVIAAANEISLEYVFGSDEYMGNTANFDRDVMGIWISGPGIVGDPLYNNQELISVLPGTATPVNYATVNAATNFEYFRMNGETDLGPRYDGMTTDILGAGKKTLTAAANVQQCSTYHLKIAIADNDVGFGGGADSGVFLNGLNLGALNTSLLGVTSFDQLIEGCTNSDQLDLTLTNPLNQDLTLNVVIQGTATQGTDYTLNIPNTITFPAGQTDMSFPITVIDDGMLEGLETIIVSFIYDYGCGSTDFATVTIEIDDTPNFQATNGLDTVFVCAGSSIQLSAEGATSYSWSPAGTLDNPNISNPTATPTVSQIYTVNGVLGACNLTDQVFVEIIDPTINLVATSPTDICAGSSVSININDNVNSAGLTWMPITGIDDLTSSTPTITPSITTTYTATVSIAGCSVSDQITINVDPFEFPTLTTMDTVICQGESLTLASATPGSPTNFLWSPNSELSDPNISNTVATPTSTTTYTLTATSVNGFCSQSADVNIEVIPASLEIQGGNFYELCLGETVDLTAITSTNGVGLTWTPDSSLTSGTAQTVTASPIFTTDYTAQLVVGGCTLQEIVTVKVDSIPDDTSISAIPQKDTYCEGEFITLISPSLDISFFPDAVFNWTPNDASLVSEADNYNIAITALADQTYTRTITNGTCSNTENITIDVVEIDVELNTSDVELCFNEEIQLEATGADSYEWSSPGNNFSCGDCPNPIMAGLADNVVTVVGEIDGCTDTESFNVSINESPICESVTVSPNSTVSLGESVQLTATYTSSSPVTIEWTVNGGTPVGQGDSIMLAINETLNDFTAIVTNSNGCICGMNIQVIGVKPVIKMPNVFTPDGDGVNDRFDIMFTAEGTNTVVERGAVEVTNFRIYNRWGNKVYDNESPDLGWDGKQNDKIAPSDVYTYFLEVLYPNGTTEVAKGDVTLIR